MYENPSKYQCKYFLILCIYKYIYLLVIEVFIINLQSMHAICSICIRMNSFNSYKVQCLKSLVKYICMSLRADRNLLRYPVIFLFIIERKEYPTSNRMKNTKKKTWKLDTVELFIFMGPFCMDCLGFFFGVFVWMSFRGCFSFCSFNKVTLSFKICFCQGCKYMEKGYPRIPRKFIHHEF